MQNLTNSDLRNWQPLWVTLSSHPKAYEKSSLSYQSINQSTRLHDTLINQIKVIN